MGHPERSRGTWRWARWSRHPARQVPRLTLGMTDVIDSVSSIVYTATAPPTEARLAIEDRGPLQRQPQGLVDILDKILDKGLVVAGDVKVSLANVELLTIQLRLVICSIDKAEAIGINWWRSDRFYSADPRAVQAAEYDELRNRIADLERQLNARELPAGKPGERKGR